ncbi:glycosyltransferase family 4 protein [Kistimonas asteriae]|uniref:glycosyltransferase family 4 protein n=1 Tax=Kistimonas asteriae TaxID=517724 RepID=UPI001BA9C077|nr:glycosyltransferase family 4 protein [Kistimonas asteriae]
MVHNRYQVHGGEDVVFENEKNLLAFNSFSVSEYVVTNTSINGFLDQVKTLKDVKFSEQQRRIISERVSLLNPCLIHAHNIFPLLTPSIFHACQDAGVPVVYTLHNFRNLCPTATLMDDGKICERSLQASSWWTVPKRVYRNSLIGTAALAYMVDYHKSKGTWQTHVDRYIALTEFAKAKFIAGGFPADKISVKPNFIEDPQKGNKIIEKKGGYAVFVGRLSEEKGLSILLEAWKAINYPLKIIGDGPMKSFVEKQSANNLNIQFLGFQNTSTIFYLLQNADFMIMPSTWYETFGLVMIEAFANGTPALVSNIGSMAEIVSDGKTGLHFEVGNPDSLAEKAEYLILHPKITREMGVNSRQEYLQKYTPEINIEILLDIYRQTIRVKKGVCPF